MDADALRWDPPGPGQWYASKEHMPTPMSGLMAELLPLAGRGWRLGTDRYGLPPNSGTFGVVNCWGYYTPGQRGAVDLEALAATAAETLATRRWRLDLARWRDEVRPAVTAVSRGLLSEDLSALDDAALAEHVQATIDHFAAQGPEHFAAMPRGAAALGALLQAAESWGLDRRAVLEALAGSSPASASAERQYERIAGALRTAGVHAPASLEDIRGAGPEANEALDELLLEHGWRPFGADLVDPTLAERPDAIVAAVRAALAGWSERGRPDGAALDALAEQVPAGERARFDELVADARAGYGDNDDNTVVLFSLPLGTVRRAALEVGRRLHERGRLADPRDAFDATPAELVELARTGEGPSADDLAARRRFRAEVAAVEPPPAIGEPLPPEPPLDLPPSVRELEALLDAFGVVASAGSAPEQDRAAVSIGTQVVRGRAVVVDDPTEAILRMEPGDVLVALTTSAPFNTIFPLAGAVVVEVGSLMSHAAVLARELGLTALIGVPDLLARVADGALVEVDPTAGTIVVVG